MESSPAIVDGVVYVGSYTFEPGSYTGAVNALDAATGAVKWSTAIENGTTSSPSVVGGVVYVGSIFGAAYALDAATGRGGMVVRPPGLWGIAGLGEHKPAVVGGVVYIGLGDHTRSMRWTRRRAR